MKNKEILPDIIAEQLAEQFYHEALADATKEVIELPLHGGHFICEAKVEYSTNTERDIENINPPEETYFGLEVAVYNVSFMDFEDNERYFCEKSFCKKLIECYKENLNIK